MTMMRDIKFFAGISWLLFLPGHCHGVGIISRQDIWDLYDLGNISLDRVKENLGRNGEVPSSFAFPGDRVKKIPLCSYEICNCTEGVIDCDCSRGVRRDFLKLEGERFTLDTKHHTLQVQNCETVLAGSIFKTNSHNISTLIFNKIDLLLVETDSLRFDLSTILFLGQVANITAGSRGFATGIQQFYIYRSEIGSLDSSTFEAMTSVRIIGLREVTFPQFNSERGIPASMRIFPATNQLIRFIVNGCNLGTIYGQLIRCTSAKSVSITNSTMDIQNKHALDIESEKVVLENCSISGNELGGIRIAALDSFTMASNTIVDNKTSIISLSFPRERLDSLKIQNSQLGLLEERFLNFNTRYLEISGCSMQLTKSQSIVGSAVVFNFSNNVLDGIKTEAFNVSVSERFVVTGNHLDHPQPDMFSRLAVVPGTLQTFHFTHNQFASVEAGFLRFHASVPQRFASNPGDFTITRLYIDTDCYCEMPQDELFFVKRKPLIKKPAGQTDTSEERFFLFISEQVYCNSLDGTPILLNESGTCEDHQALTWVAVLLLFLTITILTVIIVLRIMREKLRERALDRFIVPTTRPSLGSIQLERVETWNPGSLPDLLSSLHTCREEPNAAVWEEVECEEEEVQSLHSLDSQAGLQLRRNNFDSMIIHK